MRYPIKESDLAGSAESRYSEPVPERLVYCVEMLHFHGMLTKEEHAASLRRIAKRYPKAGARPPLPAADLEAVEP